MAVRKVPAPKKPGGVKRPGKTGPKPYPMPTITPDSKKPGRVTHMGPGSGLAPKNPAPRRPTNGKMR